MLPGTLLYVVDEIAGHRFLVDSGASYSILPFRGTGPQSGPHLKGPAGQHIPCWGERAVTVAFGGRNFSWRFLQAAVAFPILGMDFLKYFNLLVDPAGRQLLHKNSGSVITAAELVCCLLTSVADVGTSPGGAGPLAGRPPAADY